MTLFAAPPQNPTPTSKTKSGFEKESVKTNSVISAPNHTAEKTKPEHSKKTDSERLEPAPINPTTSQKALDKPQKSRNEIPSITVTAPSINPSNLQQEPIHYGSLELDENRDKIISTCEKIDPKLIGLNHMCLPYIEPWKISSLLCDISTSLEDGVDIFPPKIFNDYIHPYTRNLSLKKSRKVRQYFHIFSKCFYALHINPQAPTPPSITPQDLTRKEKSNRVKS
jgi:hypothetical protein